MWYMSPYPGVGTCPGHYGNCAYSKLIPGMDHNINFDSEVMIKNLSLSAQC